MTRYICRLGLLLCCTTPLLALDVAVLPPVGDAAVLEQVRASAFKAGSNLVELSPDEVVADDNLTPANYPVAVILSETDFLDTVAEDGDAALALQQYVDNGGALVVIGQGAAMSRPLRWTGQSYATVAEPLRRANLLVHLGLLDAGLTLYQPLPANAKLAVHVPGALAGRVPEQLAVPGGDSPFRFLPAAQIGRVTVTPIAELVDDAGETYGAAMAIVEQVTAPDAGPVCFVWAPLLQGDLAGELLVGLAGWREEAARLAAEEEAKYSGDPVKDGDAAWAEHAQPVVAMQFNKGVVYLELWPDIAPKTVESFESLIGKQFYDGIFVHRVEPGFVVQAGDPTTKELGGPTGPGVGSGGPGYTVPAEFSDTQHVKGTLSMARTADPDSAGSQFFICLDRAAHLDHQYSAFGKVLGNGMDVVDRLKVGDRIVHGWVVKPSDKPAQ